jgi:hypothetical protein
MLDKIRPHGLETMLRLPGRSLLLATVITPFAVRIIFAACYPVLHGLIVIRVIAFGLDNDLWVSQYT